MPLLVLLSFLLTNRFGKKPLASADSPLASTGFTPSSTNVRPIPDESTFVVYCSARTWKDATSPHMTWKYEASLCALVIVLGSGSVASVVAARAPEIAWHSDPASAAS